MSPGNVELVRRVFEAWDDAGISTAIRFLDSEAELQIGSVAIDEGAIRGREAIAAYFKSLVDQLWEAFGVEAANYESVGQHHVVVDVRLSGRGPGSGAPVEQRFAEAIELRGGMITWLGVYPDRPAALEAAQRRS